MVNWRETTMKYDIVQWGATTTAATQQQGKANHIVVVVVVRFFGFAFALASTPRMRQQHFTSR